MKIKTLLPLLAACLTGLLLVGCGGSGGAPVETGGESVSDTAVSSETTGAATDETAAQTEYESASATDAETVPETEAATADETDAATEPAADSETQSETKAQPETAIQRTEVEMDIYANGYTNNLVVGFDEQGRSVPAVSARKEDKEVGIFYFLWLGQHGGDKIYDNSHILEEHGPDVMFHQDLPGVSPAWQFHWWEEPLYGYYNSGDEWVIRRHMEMLTEAGIDFLCFDVTNANIYQNVAKRVMKVIEELRSEGWDAPQVTWMTHSYSIRTAQTIYETFYKEEIYPESWYRVDGKPMIIAYTDAAPDIAEAASRGDHNYNPGNMPQELQDFFYIREPRWPYDPVKETSWPYTEWTYPQPLNGGDMVSVSVACHTAVPFSFSVSRENWPDNWGRGWSTGKKQNIKEDIMKGTFFDAQWRTLKRTDARFVMITGWNEWVAQKNLYDGEYAFVDNFDMEYSRDIEPMKGGYEDAYFIQMMKHIREFKYESMEGKIAAAVRKTIDVTGSPAQWSDINAIYRRVGRDDGARRAYDAVRVEFLETDPVRNSLTEIRVTVDAENVYFYIKAEEAIVSADDENWMNIFIGTGSAPTMKGWESYEYVINRSRSGNSATIEKLNADYTGEKLEATATFSVQGNVMQVSVPRAALGIENPGDFYFKVADGVVDTDEIMDYYSTGRSMPMGRLSYLYQIGNLD